MVEDSFNLKKEKLFMYDLKSILTKKTKNFTK